MVSRRLTTTPAAESRHPVRRPDSPIIEDEAVQGLTLEQAVNRMKGPINTKTG